MTFTYPTIPEHVLQRISEEAVRNDWERPGPESVDEQVVWAGSGEKFDLSTLENFDRFIEELKREHADKPQGEMGDWIEGLASPGVLKALDGLSILSLDDPGFWRYLSLRYFWDFTVWRESSAFGKAKEHHQQIQDGEDVEGDGLGYRVYINGRKPSECVAMRMYLRGRIARDGGDVQLASGLTAATDFWRSHIVRVRTGTAPALAAAFIRYQGGETKMSTDELRDFARRLNRLWSNIQLWSYDDQQECEQLLKELGS